MGRKKLQVSGLFLVMLAGGIGAGAGHAETSPEQKQFDAEIDGAIIFGSGGRIKKLVLGDWNAVDLGPGQFSRWSPTGKKIAVLSGSKIFVLSPDGSHRTQLVSDAHNRGDCPLEFHANGREIIYLKGGHWWAVNIVNKSVRQLARGRYSGEPAIAGDGKRMVCRARHTLWAIDLIRQTRRRYGRNCSPSISPDGRRIMRNLSGHKAIEIRNWNGSGKFKITHAPRLDNHHWSNHNDYIVGQQDKGKGIYVYKVSEKRVTCVYRGASTCPDLYVGKVAAGK